MNYDVNYMSGMIYHITCITQLTGGDSCTMAASGFDAVDEKMLAELGRNSRISASELASIVGLTRQAVTERMERLRSAGVIRRFTLALDPEKIGLDVRAYIAITM